MIIRLRDIVNALSGKIEIRFWDGKHHVFMGKCNSRQELLKSKAYEICQDDEVVILNAHNDTLFVCVRDTD